MYIYVCIILFFQLTLLYRNHEMFTRFVNMLMSDVTYLLDESLSKLSEIHQIQLEMEDTAAWEAQPVVKFCDYLLYTQDNELIIVLATTTRAGRQFAIS